MAGNSAATMDGGLVAVKVVKLAELKAALWDHSSVA